MRISSSMLRRVPQKLVSKAQRSFLWLDRDADLPVILVSGVARSGTTWIAEVVSAATRARLIFEPFAPDGFPDYGFPNFTFRGQDEEDPSLEAFCSQLFAGRLRHRWIDSQPRAVRPRARVVKTVRASFMLGWIGTQFPQVRIILVSRNPWSVVRSRIRLGWHPKPDLDALTSQPRLMENLGEFAEDILGAYDLPELEANAVLWAVCTRAPLFDPPAERLLDCRYEALATNPKASFATLLGRLGLPVRPGGLRHVHRPSATSNCTGPRSAGYVQFREEFGANAARRVAEISERWGLQDWLRFDERADLSIFSAPARKD